MNSHLSKKIRLVRDFRAPLLAACCFFASISLFSSAAYPQSAEVADLLHRAFQTREFSAEIVRAFALVAKWRGLHHGRSLSIGALGRGISCVTRRLRENARF